jgi:hypothetical protein
MLPLYYLTRDLEKIPNPLIPELDLCPILVTPSNSDRRNEIEIELETHLNLLRRLLIETTSDSFLIASSLRGPIRLSDRLLRSLPPCSDNDFIALGYCYLDLTIWSWIQRTYLLNKNLGSIWNRTQMGLISDLIFYWIGRTRAQSIIDFFNSSLNLTGTRSPDLLLRWPSTFVYPPLAVGSELGSSTVTLTPTE